ncbi:hypothetical protein RQM59_06640 [Flavobacteriaceae bacterium S356]|uniref:Carboxypeptidase-like protein n=1 Tax=Asprobacillus argus TaxID=3076534 RepID=A0ABU3LEG9_9FLAO|nr:hypothetical protein [Flavobacteriaceae bacterium S356]
MKKKLHSLVILFLLSSALYSQKKKVFIYGKVLDSVSLIKNANILNLSTNKGTSSNDQGEFRMYVSLGDSLRISSVQHETAISIITKYNIESKHFAIRLKRKTYILDEIVLKKHNLIGSLTSDTKQTPENKKETALKNTMDFSKVDMTAPVADDHIDKNVRPHTVQTDPNQAFGMGAGTKFVMPFKYSERLWALRRQVSYQKKFPELLLEEFGASFFYVDLKIPREKYHHFLEFCNPLGIEKLYLQQKKLDVIKILKRESIAYHKILKESKETPNEEK